MRIHTPRPYKACDGATQAVIYFMVIFTPWAFGTTDNWSIWVANISAYLLGGLLMIKWMIRWKTGYQPERWGTSAREEGGGLRISRGLNIALAGLTVLILGYCLTGALNARASFDPKTNHFEYHDCIEWLPASYDSVSTWQAFWSYLGLAFFFWATHDWLLGQTSKERRESRSEDGEDSIIHRAGSSWRVEPRSASAESQSFLPPAATANPEDARSFPPAVEDKMHRRSTQPHIPSRLRLLLWILCINGGLLALEGILQRLDGTGKLLWMIEPRFNKTADAQFGPYAYRSNAAAYINIVWPVCLGFWLALRKAMFRRRLENRKVGGGSQALLLPCAVVMAASPIFSTSRGGALVGIVQILVTTVILFVATRRERTLIRVGSLSLSICILGLTAYLGWKQLQERLENVFVDNLSNRTEIYANAKQIAADFPVLGTGAGTFGSVYFLYKEAAQTWEAYLHDDWMETRTTFGWVGFGLILVMLGIVLLRWFAPGGIRASWELVMLTWLGMAGCLFHAKFDFPFQIYSILLLFLLLCGILFSVSRSENGNRG